MRMSSNQYYHDPGSRLPVFVVRRVVRIAANGGNLPGRFAHGRVEQSGRLLRRLLRCRPVRDAESLVLLIGAVPAVHLQEEPNQHSAQTTRASTTERLPVSRLCRRAVAPIRVQAHSFSHARQGAIREVVIHKHARGNQLLNQRPSSLDLPILLRTQDDTQRSENRHVVSDGEAPCGAVVEHSPRSQCSMVTVAISSTRYLSTHSSAVAAVRSLCCPARTSSKTESGTRIAGARLSIKSSRLTRESRMIGEELTTHASALLTMDFVV